MSNPTRNYAIEWILRKAGLTQSQVTAAITAATGAIEPTDATGAVFGDVVGALLGPLLVQAIHGDEISPPALAADVDDYDPSGRDALIWRLDLAGFALTGIAAPDTPGELHLLVAVTAGRLAHQDGGSAAANQFTCAAGADVELDDDELALIVYDGTSETWRVLAPGSSSSGATSATSNEVTPPLQLAIGPWVGPSGAGQITLDPQGRFDIDTSGAYKSFPGLAFLDGRLHAVWRTGSAHISTGSAIRYSYSDKYGVPGSWSAPITIAAAPAGSHDYRDPSITALSTGRLLVGIDTATGTGGAGTLRGLFTMYSDDHGANWSAPAMIPDTDTNQGAGTCPALELPDGTVLLPGYVDPASNTHYSSVFWRSDDHGATFDPTYVVIAAYGARDYNETKLLFTADGVVRAFMRTDTGGAPHHTYLTTASLDDLSTWSAPTAVNEMTGRPDIIEFYPKALVQIGRYNTNVNFDSPLHFATSWDGGETWTTPDELDAGETGFAMYNAPILLAPGLILNIYAIEYDVSNADVYARYLFDGYGTDVLGNVRALIGGTLVDTTPPTPGQVLTATSSSESAWADPEAVATTHWEVLMADGITDPPDPLVNEAGDDWLYGEIA